MQVGRSTVGGNAIMMLSVDNHVEQVNVDRMKELEDIYDVIAIDL